MTRSWKTINTSSPQVPHELKEAGHGTTTRAGKGLAHSMHSVNGGYHCADIGGDNLVLSWSFVFLPLQPSWK